MEGAVKNPDAQNAAKAAAFFMSELEQESQNTKNLAISAAVFMFRITDGVEKNPDTENMAIFSMSGWGWRNWKHET